MIIKSIQLSNFRNYEKLDISFDSETNIIYGDNAQGKTNILEAAYLSGTTKSHKGSKDKEMIRRRRMCALPVEYTAAEQAEIDAFEAMFEEENHED